MDLSELEKQLQGLAPDERISISHDHLNDMFPPGEPDIHAREACYSFAKKHGCRIENDLQECKVWFIKDANMT